MVLPIVECDKCELMYRVGSNHVCKEKCENCCRLFKKGKKHTCRFTDCDECGNSYRMSKGHKCEKVKNICGFCNITEMPFDEDKCINCLEKEQGSRRFTRKKGKAELAREEGILRHKMSETFDLFGRRAKKDKEIQHDDQNDSSDTENRYMGNIDDDSEELNMLRMRVFNNMRMVFPNFPFSLGLVDRNELKNLR